MSSHHDPFFDDEEDVATAQRKALLEGLSRFLQHLVSPDGAPTKLSPKTIGLRTISALWTIDPTLFASACNSHTIAPSSCELALAIKGSDGKPISAAIISRYACQFRDHFGIKTESGRTQDQRDRYAISRLKLSREIGDSSIRSRKHITAKAPSNQLDLFAQEVDAVGSTELN